MSSDNLAHSIARLQGPVLVLGASGFIGANLLAALRAVRQDTFGTASTLPAWRLQALPPQATRVADLLVEANTQALLDEIKPRTVFNCVAYGGYSFQTDPLLIHRTNFISTAALLEILARRNLACYVHAGSSSEYGTHCAGPREGDALSPNSHYSVSKGAAAGLIHFMGKRRGLPCANLRLYSVYGPLEDSSRLIPIIVREGLGGRYPDLVNPAVSRDFVYIDDVCRAFVDTALNLREENYGESFNIGTGVKTTIGQVAALAQELFAIAQPPRFAMANRDWDLTDWYANVDKAKDLLGWQPHTALRDGLGLTAQWYRSLADPERYCQSSKQFALDTKHSVSVVIVCHNDAQTLPEAYRRLTTVMKALRVEYQLVFVDDASDDQTEQLIRDISANDRRVLGASHSRRFGTAAGFLSGMALATQSSCVLTSADLRDPPEVIERFLECWRQGAEVVYGIPDRPDQSRLARLAEGVIHRVHDAFAYVRIPRRASDFCLLDAQVARSILGFPERNMFLAGIRAFAGFRQVGVPYTPGRVPNRPRHTSDAMLLSSVRGLLSFSHVPLRVLTVFGLLLAMVTACLGVAQIVLRLLYPERSASGITTVLLAIFFFGSTTICAIGLIGEYISRIFDDVKQRPVYIRRTFTRDGEVRAAGTITDGREVPH